MTSRLAKCSLLLVVLFMVGCDHATKHAAVQLLSARRPVELVPGVLDLRYAENHDTAFAVAALRAGRG
jgi:signal peptidase II